jgi:pimeloyl-ACP methyl ester carboxylesterase
VRWGRGRRSCANCGAAWVRSNGIAQRTKRPGLPGRFAFALIPASDGRGSSIHSERGGVYCQIEMSDKDVNSLTLVLLPGLDGTGNLFAPLIPELPRTLSVITAAYPSERFLSYPELVSWLGELVPRDSSFAILGESYGSTLAVKFAATHPPNLIGVILCAGFISNPVRRCGPLPKLLARPLFFRFRPPDFLREYFVAGFRAPEGLKLALRDTVRSVNTEVFAKRARAVIDCDARQEIREVKVPLLYLQAAEDRLVGSACLDEIKRFHPETISISIRAPHLLLQREPRAAARAITQFLDTYCRPKGSGSESSSTG